MRTRFTRFAQGGRNVPIAAGLVALLLVAIGIVTILQNEVGYRAQKLREAEVQAEILAASVTAALDFQDAPTAREAVDALGVNPQIVSAGVYDSGGTLFAGYERRRGTLPRRTSDRSAGGENEVEAIAPVVRSGERIGSVHLVTQREPLARRITRYGLVALLVLLAAMVVGALALAHTVLRRANRQLEDRAEALSEAYAELQVQVEERARAEDQLRQAQKMQALGQLTGGIAHDFNNLLTVIQGSADILRRPNLDESKRVRFAEAIIQTTGRAAALTAQILAFARRQPLKPQVIDLNEKIRTMTELLDRTLGERVKVETELWQGGCRIEADPAQLEAAILNVAVNARDAMPDGGTLTLRTSGARFGEEQVPAMALSFTDSGTGIGEEALARVFEPFFTTKAVGKGTGLGLSQVYGFATQSGGDIRIESRLGEGTTVTLILPCSDRPGDEATETERRPETRMRTGKVLVVDDNEEVGMFAETLLEEIGYKVVRSSSGEEALDRARAEPFDLVFTDIVMPGMSGLQLADILKTEMPSLAVILTTGFSDEVLKSGTGGRAVVLKPYRLETLCEALDEALAKG